MYLEFNKTEHGVPSLRLKGSTNDHNLWLSQLAKTPDGCKPLLLFEYNDSKRQWEALLTWDTEGSIGDLGPDLMTMSPEDLEALVAEHGKDIEPKLSAHELLSKLDNED